MKIKDLMLPDPRLRGSGSVPDADPLTEEDALQEAQLLDLRFDTKAGVAGLLFELRVALQLRSANTGVMILSGMRELAWSAASRETALTAWSIGSSAPWANNRLFGLRLDMSPGSGARLSLTAQSAAFFLGNVPGLAQAPPDYGELDRARVDAELAGWESPFELISASFSEQPP